MYIKEALMENEIKLPLACPHLSCYPVSLLLLGAEVNQQCF